MLKRDPRTYTLITVLCWLLAEIAMAASPGREGKPGMQQVNIYGDGDPANGIEDDRITRESPRWLRDVPGAWKISAGTIDCDGRIRGSATILDVGEFGIDTKGLVLATSAHVLVDLESGRRFRKCSFHYTGSGHLPGFKGAVDLGNSVFGDFEPGRPRASPGFGKGDWAFLYVPDSRRKFAPGGRIRIRPFHHVAEAGAGAETAPEYLLIGYSFSHGGMTISPGCRVEESGPEDIGGGTWQGQLLDDCDSSDGASGGGLIARVGDDYFLVGIRTGSHWDHEAFPSRNYPDGPPEGSEWNVRLNTNFARAVDRSMIAALRQLLAEIERKTRGGQV